MGESSGGMGWRMCATALFSEFLIARTGLRHCSVCLFSKALEQMTQGFKGIQFYYLPALGLRSLTVNSAVGRIELLLETVGKDLLPPFPASEVLAPPPAPSITGHSIASSGLLCFAS